MKDKIKFTKIKDIKELDEAIKYLPENTFYPVEYKKKKLIIAPYKVYNAVLEDNIDLLD